MNTLTDDASMDQWIELMGWSDVPDEVTTSHALDVNADRVLRCWVLVHKITDKLPISCPSPTYTIRLPEAMISVWHLRVPVPPDKTKAVNAWRMTMAMLTHALDGRELAVMPNPLSAEQLHWIGHVTTLHQLKRSLIKAGHAGHQFYEEARRLGGQSMTEAQTAARRENIKVAQEAARRFAAERADARAAEVVAIADSGANPEALANELGVKPGSVKTTVARARLRLLPQEISPVPDGTPAADQQIGRTYGVSATNSLAVVPCIKITTPKAESSEHRQRFINRLLPKPEISPGPSGPPAADQQVQRAPGPDDSPAEDLFELHETVTPTYRITPYRHEWPA